MTVYLAYYSESAGHNSVLGVYSTLNAAIAKCVEQHVPYHRHGPTWEKIDHSPYYAYYACIRDEQGEIDDFAGFVYVVAMEVQS